MNADNVGPLLDALSARFGSTGAHLWTAIQHQAYLEFYTALGLALPLLGLWLLRWAKPPEDSFDGSMAIALLTLLSMGWLVATLVTLQGVLNPDYYALHEVLRALR